MRDKYAVGDLVYLREQKGNHAHAIEDVIFSTPTVILEPWVVVKLDYTVHFNRYYVLKRHTTQIGQADIGEIVVLNGKPVKVLEKKDNFIMVKHANGGTSLEETTAAAQPVESFLRDLELLNAAS